MQIKINQKKFSSNIRKLMRKIGYLTLRDPKSREIGYVRRLRRSFYPRFHIHPFLDQKGNLILNLHYDLAKPMHKKGTSRVESKGKVLEEEARRIRSRLG